MIVVEGTLWPLVVVGAIPELDAAADFAMPLDEEPLWPTRVLRLALVVAGTGGRATAAHHEVCRWLHRYKTTLCRRTLRVAWIIEDDTMRTCAQEWLTLVGDRLFSGEATAFRALGPALSWLLDDAPGRCVVRASR